MATNALAAAGEQRGQNRQNERFERLEVACVALCAVLERGALEKPADEATCRMLLTTWLEDCDPNEEVAKDAHENDAHEFGAALSVCLYEALRDELRRFDLHQALGRHKERVCVHTAPLHTLRFQQTLDLILSLQIEFAEMYKTDKDGAIVSSVDTETIVIMLLAHLGSSLGHRWREATETLEVVHGVIEAADDGWHSVAPQSAVAALDAVHAMLVASRMLNGAECIQTQPPPPIVFNFHREASLDDFYDVSTAADCPVGAILQYKHRFRYLFHSVSQVVYFHYPAYQRQKQLTLEQLQTTNAPALNLLPLLAQVAIDIPVLAEHSKLGFRTEHQRHQWVWAVVAKRVLLVRSDMKTFCALDLRTLLLHACPGAADKNGE
jgi:hypothetical protein